MKNSIYFKYYINKELLKLLGISEEEIYNVDDYSNIYFKRFEKNYKITVSITYTTKNELKLSLSEESESFSSRYSDLFRIEGILEDKDFAKFRRILNEYIVDTKVYNCKN